jgi:hypothetical protein
VVVAADVNVDIGGKKQALNVGAVPETRVRQRHTRSIASREHLMIY